MDPVPDTVTPAAADTVTPAVAPTPATTPSPVTTHIVDNPKPGEPTVQVQPNAEFKIPDAYKDKPWASKIKNQEDLYKQIDNLDQLAGKKTIRDVPDFKTATPEQIEAYYASTRPADPKAYEFPAEADVLPEQQDAIRGILHKAGIEAERGSEIIKNYLAVEQAGLAAAYSAEGFEAEMKGSFGDAFKERGAKSLALLKENLSPEDQKFMDEKLPNSVLGFVYRLADKMQQTYGVNETGAQVNGGQGSPPPTDLKAVQKDLRAKITEIAKNPFAKAGEKQALIDQLNATYTRK